MEMKQQKKDFDYLVYLYHMFKYELVEYANKFLASNWTSRFEFDEIEICPLTKSIYIKAYGVRKSDGVREKYWIEFDLRDIEKCNASNGWE